MSNSIEVKIGGSVFNRYQDLNYELWYAIAEFIDNSSHSYLNNKKELDEGRNKEKFKVDVVFQNGELLSVVDNAYGMDKKDLEDLVNVGRKKAAANSGVQRSEFGMGLKTGGFWLGKKIKIITKKFNEMETLTAELDIEKLIKNEFLCEVNSSVEHDLKQSFTIIEITSFNRKISQYKVRKTKDTLASLYSSDLTLEKMVLTWNGDPVEPYRRDVAVEDGAEKKWDINIDVNGRKVTGFVAGLIKGGKHGSGRSNSGFSISRNGRNVNSFPNWWKPESIYGYGGRNDLVNQRLFGELEFDKSFGISQTKDKIMFSGDEEDTILDELEKICTEAVNWVKMEGGYYARGDKKGLSKRAKEEVDEKLGDKEVDDIITSRKFDDDKDVMNELKEVLKEYTSGSPDETYNIGSTHVCKVWYKDNTVNDKYVYISNYDISDMRVVISTVHPAYEKVLSSGDEKQKASYVLNCVYDAVCECLLKRDENNEDINPHSFRHLKDKFLKFDARN